MYNTLATLSRLTEWFAGQPEAVQQAVGNARANDLARTILGAIAAKRP